MNLSKFIEKIAECFDEVGISEFKSDMAFKKLEGWSSLITLSIIAMVDEEYSVTIKGTDIKNAETIEDLFNIVKEYKA